MTIQTIPPDFALQGDEAPSAHVVLVNPQIPPNTGNIARLCAGTGSWLHVVEPLGFKLEDRYLKRAGLDYWPATRFSVHSSLDALEDALPSGPVHVLTRHATAMHFGADFSGSAPPVLVFGCETRGLPEEFRRKFADRCLRIPTTSDVRSLNLANSVAIVLYEALRQRGFKGGVPAPNVHPGKPSPG